MSRKTLSEKEGPPFLDGASSDVDFTPAPETDEPKPIEMSSAAPIPTPKQTRLSVNHIPVTVITGYLGAGKTTVITNLMKQMPEDYSIAWLKNEMGNTAVDTELAQDTQVATVKEMLQGCICHVLIGQLGAALDEMLESKPDRIIIETSGSATPAPIVWQIRNHGRLYADSVVTVIDAKHFKGYVNKSPSLKIQAKFTDLILINKHEDLDEATLEQNLDDLYEINLDTPKVKTDRGTISPELVFGLDSKLFMTREEVDQEEEHADYDHHVHEVELLEVRPTGNYDPQELIGELEGLSKSAFYRIKGVLRSGEGVYIMNCSFGECSIIPLPSMSGEQRLVCMGDGLAEHRDRLAGIFGLSGDDLIFTPKEHHHHHDHGHDYQNEHDEHTPHS